MKVKVKYFTLSEFECKCCCSGRPALLLVFWLEVLRGAWGAPVLINSGCRCAKHNAEVGGASQSRHLIGCAADIRPQSREFYPAFKGLVLGMTENLVDWEVIPYDKKGFVHVAVPRCEAASLWNGGIIYGSFSVNKAA